MKQKYIKEFKVDLSGLTVDEKKVVGLLVQAAKLIAPIYEKQVNDRYPGANFYPHDATREEIEKANQKDPAILDSYTIVERKDGKLVAIPYHVKYKKELEPIAKLLKEAAKITKDKEFVDYLSVRADSLLNGRYEKADIFWLKLPTFKINLVIGPIERYDDKLFFKKTAYQCWVGIVNEKETKKAMYFRDIVFNAKRKTSVPQEKVNFLEKVEIRIDKTLIFSGLISRFMFISTNLPNDVNLMEKYGSEITIFEPSLDLKFKNQHYPIFKAVFEKKFQENYSSPILKEGTLWNILGHEISHPLLRYKKTEERLKEYFPVFDEIEAYVLGVKNCGSLLLKDVISQKQLESIMVIFLCRAFSWWQDMQKEPTVVDYVRGYAIALNFLLSSGALRETRGIYWPNFTKFFICLDELSNVLERILAAGNYEDAKRFVQRYGSFKIFERFNSRLKRGN